MTDCTGSGYGLEGVGDASERDDVELLAAHARVHRRRPEGSLRRGRGSGQTGKCRSQHLAALRERSVDHRERVGASGPDGGGGRRLQATRPESTLGAGQKTVRPT